RAIDVYPKTSGDTAGQHFGDPFFHTFGRASRATVAAAETKREPTLSQALHLAVGDSVRDRLSSGGVIKTLIETKSTPEDIIDELFIRGLSRRPTTKEMTAMRELVGDDVKDQAVYEDILWSLLNSTEFLFNY
ncbi:MAG: cell surface protein, partial [Planctomycetes bacterium]|nr:cell surface protein [Planctomycetota bacterium]